MAVKRFTLMFLGLLVLLAAACVWGQEVNMTPQAEFKSGQLIVTVNGRNLDKVTWIRVAGEVVTEGWTTSARGTSLTFKHRAKGPIQESQKLRLEMGPGQFALITILLTPKNGGRKSR